MLCLPCFARCAAQARPRPPRLLAGETKRDGRCKAAAQRGVQIPRPVGGANEHCTQGGSSEGTAVAQCPTACSGMLLAMASTPAQALGTRSSRLGPTRASAGIKAVQVAQQDAQHAPRDLVQPLAVAPANARACAMRSGGQPAGACYSWLLARTSQPTALVCARRRQTSLPGSSCAHLEVMSESSSSRNTMAPAGKPSHSCSTSAGQRRQHADVA